MTRYVMTLASTIVVVLMEFGMAHADVLTVTPSRAVALPADGSGMTKVALFFDLGELRSGSDRRIDEALLDWRVSPVPSDRRSEYAAFAITGVWTAAGADAGVVVPIDLASSADWEIEPLDYERNDGGFVRFDLTELIRAWSSGSRINHGIVVATDDLASRDLTKQFSGAELTIRYGLAR